MLTDEQLMLEARGGSGGAFEAIFDRYREPLWRFFRRRVDDAGRAEELAHDVFVALLQGAGRYEPRAPFRSYLFGIAYNLLLADRRRSLQHAAGALHDNLAAPLVDVDAALWVRSALAALEPEAREIVMLREYEQLSYDDIASILGIPLNTVRSRLFRARMDLKSALSRQLGRAGEGRP